MKTKNPKPYATLLADIQADYLLKLPHKLKEMGILDPIYQWETLHTEWHKLKGNGQTIGFKAVTQVAALMETIDPSSPRASELNRLSLELLKQLYQDQQLTSDLELTKLTEWIKLKESFNQF